MNYNLLNLILWGIIILIIIVIITALYNGKKEYGYFERTVFLLGTMINLKIWGGDGEEAIEEAIDKLNYIEDNMSAFKENSDIGKINSSKGETVLVSKDSFDLIRKTIEYSDITEGAFDPTIRPLVKLWGIGAKDDYIPEKNEIIEELKLVNYKDIQFNINNRSIRLKNKKQSIDLGGIAKGYAADEVKSIFTKNGIKSAIIDLGGNVFVMGNKIDNTPWNVGVQDPYKNRGEYVGYLKLKDKSIVTSGYYEKYFEKDGECFHHIIDPKTGYPSDSIIVSATIVSDKSIDGDGLSTGIYILGVDKGIEIINNKEEIEGVIITENKKIYITSGLKDSFILTNEEYELIYEENNYEKEVK